MFYDGIFCWTNNVRSLVGHVGELTMDKVGKIPLNMQLHIITEQETMP